jgi:hypothetical protein
MAFPKTLSGLQLFAKLPSAIQQIARFELKGHAFIMAICEDGEIYVIDSDGNYDIAKPEEIKEFSEDDSSQKIKLRALKDINMIYETTKRGEIIDYIPWNRSWQGMSEQERVQKGIFVMCYGHGEFDVLTKDDVEVVSDITYLDNELDMEKLTNLIEENE